MRAKSTVDAGILHFHINADTHYGLRGRKWPSGCWELWLSHAHPSLCAQRLNEGWIPSISHLTLYGVADDCLEMAASNHQSE